MKRLACPLFPTVACLLGTLLSLPAETEPNNDNEHANPVKIGKEFSFQLTPRRDRDYFKVISPGNGTLRFRTTSEVKTHPGLYPWWGEITGDDEKLYSQRPGLWDRRVAKGETVIFSVRSAQNDWNEVESPEVIKGILDFVPQVGAEPNDAADQATPVTAGEEFEFTITPRFDRDYFTLTSPGNGTLRFRLTSELKEHKGVYPWWGEVTGEDGKSYAQRSGLWDRRVTEGEIVIFTVRSAQNSWNEVSNDAVIKGVFDFVPQVGAEPNDSADQGTPVTVGEEFAFTITPRFDRDYFTLTSPGHGTLRFRVTTKLEIHKDLYPWWGEATGDDGKSYQQRAGLWDRYVTEGETVTFAIRSAQNSWNEVSNDEVVKGIFDFVPQVGAEPNNEATQSTPVRIGEEFTFTITPRFDRDYFTVPSPGNGTLRFRLTSELKEHKGIYPWWGEVEGDDGKTYQQRPGIWDRRVVEGETITLAIRSAQNNWNEVSNDEAITGILDFVPQIGAETNDTAAQATPVKLGELIEFSITPQHDRDYFTLPSPGFGTLLFRLTTDLKEHKGLYPWWGETKGNDDKLYEVRGGKWDRRIEDGETIVFALRSAQHHWNNMSTDERITGRFEFIPQGGGSEPNDTPEQATAIEIDKPFELTFLPLHDVDYFKIADPGRGVVRLERLDNTGLFRGLYPSWVSSDGRVNGYWDMRTAPGKETVFSLRSAQHHWNESTSETPISLVARFLKEPLASERGDTAAEAIDVKVGEVFEFALLPQWDRDYIRFVPEQSGFAALRFDLAPEGDVSYWWEKPGVEKPIETATLQVEAGQEAWLGLAPRHFSWSSGRVFSAHLEYTDGPPDPKDQVRRWTFKVERQPAE